MAGRGLAAHRKKARRESAHLALIDESGFFLNPLVRRTLAPRGRTPVLESWGRHRDKVSVIAALCVSPARRRLALHFYADPEHYIDGASAAEFLRGLLRHLPGRVVVVWDRGSNHLGGALRALLARRGRLSVEYLPAYAPELNPVEYVWSYLKYGKMANFVPRGLGHLEDEVVGHLTEARHDGPLLRALWDGSDLPFPTRHSLPEGQ